MSNSKFDTVILKRVDCPLQVGVVLLFKADDFKYLTSVFPLSEEKMERNRWTSHWFKALPCSLRVEGFLNRKLNPVVGPEVASLVYAYT